MIDWIIQKNDPKKFVIRDIEGKAFTMLKGSGAHFYYSFPTRRSSDLLSSELLVHLVPMHVVPFGKYAQGIFVDQGRGHWYIHLYKIGRAHV